MAPSDASMPFSFTPSSRALEIVWRTASTVHSLAW
jgi:hypothetical protein